MAGLLACLAGTASYPGIGTALSSSLSAMARIPRIAVSSVIAPQVVAFLKEMLPHRISFAEGEILGAEAGETLAEAIGGFMSGLPTRLRDLEIEKGDLLHAAHDAYDSPMVKLGAAPINEDELHGVLKQSY
jgi:alcohol dehydrogenase class IV